MKNLLTPGAKATIVRFTHWLRRQLVATVILTLTELRIYICFAWTAIDGPHTSMIMWVLSSS